MKEWMRRDLTGWRLLAMRLIALALILLIGIGIPEAVKYLTKG